MAENLTLACPIPEPPPSPPHPHPRPLCLQLLEEHRKNCERQGKYVEAEIAKNRLEELKLHEENRRKEAMRSRQIAERLGVEEAHMLEFQQFNMVWDKKMEAYEGHAETLVEAMKVGCFCASAFVTSKFCKC